MQTNRYLRSTGSLLALVVLVAAGAGGQVRAIGRSDKVGSGYCESVTTRGTAVQTAIDQKLSVLTETWKQQGDKLTMLASSQASKLVELRGSVDAERAQNIADMRSRATNDNERQAVDAYASSIAAAVETRRQAVDEARTTYQKSLRTVLSERQATFSGQVQALKLGVADAYATAQNNCSDDMLPTDVRANLLQALTAARQHYRAEHSGDQSVGVQLQQLVNDRQASIKTANDAFQATTSAARRTLLAAFGSDARTI